jgi:hypothetical protein
VAEPKRAGNAAFAAWKLGDHMLAGMDPQQELPVKRRIALIAHDNKKADLAEWARIAEGRVDLFARRYDRLQPVFADYANRGWSAATASADQVA